jgi:hypothetical protein
MGMPTKQACFEVVNPAVLGTNSCTMVMGTCPPPGACAYHPTFGGLCSLRCDDTSACPQNGRCIETFTNVFHCFKPCTDAGDCGSFLCEMFGSDRVCIPPGWDGQTQPLPMPPMM